MNASQLHTLVQICSLLASKIHDDDGHNAKLNASKWLQTTGPSHGWLKLGCRNDLN